MAHASENTHFYTRAGDPCYDIRGANGNMRPTTLRDARKLNLVPSVTAIIRCADRPGLTNWMIDQAILAALTLPLVAGESSTAYLARIKQDSKEQARKAAERGTAIHAAIQGYFEGETSSGYEPHISGVVAELSALPWEEPFVWKAETSFSHPIGFGGKVDLLARQRAQERVIDFKTKEFSEGMDLKTWDEHAMQLAAYRHGLGMEKARCAIVYVSTTNPGLARLIEIPEEDLAKGWKCFYSLLQFYKAKNSFDPTFERALAA